MTPVGSFGIFPLAALDIERAGPAELLSIGFVTGSCYELRKLRHRDLVSIHPERFDSHFVHRRFIIHAVIGAHQEFSAFDEYHAVAISLTSVGVRRRIQLSLRLVRARSLAVQR